MPSGAKQILVMLACSFALAGCVSDASLGPTLETRMPLVIDTKANPVLHPPRSLTDGQVNPIDRRLGRERDFSSFREVAPGLGLSLAAWKSHEFPGVAAYLALAKPREKAGHTDGGKPLVDDADPELQPKGDQNKPDSSEPQRHGANDLDGGYRLNFDDAEIKDVLQSVLGNVLGLTYTIAPNVAGRITLSSAAPQNRTELLSTLETVLSLQGLALTKNGSTYRIAPATIGAGTLDETGAEPGFGITVVPLDYLSVASINKLLSGFISDADGIRVDSSRNAIIVRGPGPRRDEIVRSIKSFDRDWMHTQSVSVVELRRAHPDEVIQELTRIFDSDTNGNANGLIQFKPIKRLRSIMVISKSAQLIRRAGLWIRRLDHENTSSTDAIFVYRPRYRDAKEMVRLVNGLLNGDGGGNSIAVTPPGPSGSGTQQGTQEQYKTIGQSTSSFAGGLPSIGPGPSGGVAGQSGLGAQSGGGGNGLQSTLADAAENGGSLTGSGKLKVTADVSNNTIVAYTDGETYTKVQSILRQIDVPPLQVAVNVIVAEVQLNDELKYGVQFYLNNRRGSIGLSQVLSSSAGSALAISPQTAGLNFLLGGASSPNVILNALDSVSKVHILSTPSVVVLENKPAVFEVGNQVPVITQTAQSNVSADAPSVNSVSYLDTGIILKITPRVGQHGDVAIDLDQVISSVVPNATGGADTSLTPTISKRRINSAISVRSGEIVLLAGLVNDTRQQQKGQVPFLGGGLGDILGNKDNAFTRSELVIFIRPVIIRDGKDASEVAGEFKSQLKEMNFHGEPVYKP
jgi:general secretion pathway protein D